MASRDDRLHIIHGIFQALMQISPSDHAAVTPHSIPGLKSCVPSPFYLTKYLEFFSRKLL